MKELLKKANKIFFSDSHIPRNNPFFIEFLDCIIGDSKAVVYGVGDVFELIECTRDEVIERGAAEIALLRALAREKRLRLLPGNHDPNAGRCLGFPRYFRDDRAIYYLGDRPFWLLHGHQFDWVCKRLPWRLLGKVLPFFMTPGKVKAKGPKPFNRAVARVYNRIFSEKKNIIFGHTHFGCQIIRENDFTLINLGDMLDSCTWAMEIEGRIYLCRKWKVISDGPVRKVY